MKLLVGCFVLGCISAVLALDEVASEKPIESSPETTAKISVVDDAVTEKLITSLPDLTPRIQHSETTTSPDKNPKIVSSPSVKGHIDREIVVIRDQATGGEHHDHGYHDHHGYHDNHDHHHDHEHDYHHPPPPRPPPHHPHDHHHIPTPPHHHHYPQPYPGYYPPHYPPPYSHGMPYAAGAAVPPPPYPYYPPPTFYNSPPMKPSATIIQTSTSTSGQNYPKPTDLLNQGTEYLWNLFGKLGAVTSENHEVVLINPKPAPLATSVHVLPPNWYSNKGKIVPNPDCNNKNK